MIFPKLLASNVKAFRSGFVKFICTGTKLARGAYDAQGKTYVNILDQQRHPDLGLTIASYSQIGFRLGNGIYCVGPIAIFSRSVLSWNVGGPFDITPESLSLFLRLEPKLDILVLGIGDSLEWRQLIEKNIHTEVIKKNGINVEILTTEHACSTYNFLCSEHRLVAGAFIPPLTIEITDQDVIDTKKRFDSLYEIEPDYDFGEFIDVQKMKELSDDRKRISDGMNKEFFEAQKHLLPQNDPLAPNKEVYEIYPVVESHYEKKDREEKERQLKVIEDEKKKNVSEAKKDKNDDS